LDETINIGKEKIPFLLVRCLIGRSAANLELKNFESSALDLTVVISFFRQNKIIGEEDELNNLKNYLPDAYFERGLSLGLLGLKNDACEDLNKSLELETDSTFKERIFKAMELFECNSDHNNNSTSENNEILKFDILEGEYTVKQESGEFGETRIIENLPTLLVIENNKRIIIYGNEKRVFDIIKFLPKEEYKADNIVFQPFRAIDDNGNEMTHRLATIAGQTWLYISYPEIQLFYRVDKL
jgi:hypothetical protein